MIATFQTRSKMPIASPVRLCPSFLRPMLILSFPFFALAAPREFKSIDGKAITAEVAAVQGENVVLSMNGREFTVPVARFSQADQDFIAEWKKKDLENHVPKMRVDVGTGKSDRSDKADSFDDRLGSFQFSVKLLNEEIHFDLQGAKAELAVIGEDAETRGRYGIMQKSAFEVSAAPGKTFDWQGKRLHYRFDDRPPAYWGSSYAGYVLRIKNANGKVIYENAVPQTMEKQVDAILKMEEGAAFDRNGESRGRITIYEN
jgi:hypothetical protein